MSLPTHLAQVPDFRQPGGNLRHKLLDILVISVLAVLSGANDFVEMACFADHKLPALRRYRSLGQGPPSHDTFCRVFPFDDGNGRLAGIRMNAELVRGDLSRIISTTGYRQDYLRALRRLSRQRDPGPYLRMLARTQAFTAALPPTSYPELREQLGAVGAFEESTEDVAW